jgi:cyclic dehypoxanthinyl futalosine synthase
MLAVSRLFLDNIRNVQASWVTQGSKVGQVALAFGANDMGSTMIEENVVAAAGTRFMLAREELVRLIATPATSPFSATRSTVRCGASSRTNGRSHLSLQDSRSSCSSHRHG